mgnify:CR=1 FL=1
MILLINLIPLLLAAIGFGLSWKLRKLWIAAATVVALLLYFQAQPSYMPKGQVTRSEVPGFKESDASIEDRNSKPMPGSERDQRMHDAVKQGLDFKK